MDKYFQSYQVTISEGSILRIFYKQNDKNICFFNNNLIGKEFIVDERTHLFKNLNDAVDKMLTNRLITKHKIVKRIFI